MEIGEKIIYLRSKENLSQAKLAEIIFVSRQAISRWENRHTHPELDTVKLISKAFDYPLEWFLTEEYGIEYLEKRHPIESSIVENNTPIKEDVSANLKKDFKTPLKEAVSHLKVNKWLAASYLLLAFFPGFFFPKLLILTVSLVILALYTTYNRFLIGALLSLTTVLTLLELLSLLTLYFNWFVQTEIIEIINLILLRFI